MLKPLNKRFSYHLQAASNSLTLLCQKPLATVMTIVVIAIALTLPALFWVFTSSLEGLTKNWSQGAHISLYLKKTSRDAQAAVLHQVKAIEGVKQATLKSPAESLTELQQQEGMQDIIRYLPENPLPPLIEVFPVASLTTQIQLEQLVARLHALPEVDEVKFDMQWISRLGAIIYFITQTTHALMILLGLTVILVIGNTLRLAIQNRYEEIRILKLIGATDAYIARSFLYSGIWYSLAGAIIAILLVNIFLLTLTIALRQLALAYQMDCPVISLSVRQAYLLLLVAIGLGWMGARMSIKGQLASIEPCN